MQLLNVMKPCIWLLTIALIVSTGIYPAFAEDHQTEFTPRNGFRGASHGVGALKLMLQKSRAFQVESCGIELDDGSFRIDQVITFDGEAPRSRSWTISTASDNHHSGILTDATGPVKGVTNESYLSLHHRVKGPIFMHQELHLSANGSTIDNVGVIRMLGVTIGRLNETITRLSTACNLSRKLLEYSRPR